MRSVTTIDMQAMILKMKGVLKIISQETLELRVEFLKNGIDPKYNYNPKGLKDMDGHVAYYLKQLSGNIDTALDKCNDALEAMGKIGEKIKEEDNAKRADDNAYA
jgi:hypothetical protein